MIKRYTNIQILYFTSGFVDDLMFSHIGPHTDTGLGVCTVANDSLWFARWCR